MTANTQPAEAHRDGATLRIKAQPNARKNEISWLPDGTMRVGVTASAEKGKANAAIVKLLSRALKLHASDILVVRGATGRQKSILFRNGNVAELNKKVSALYKDWSDRSKRAKREP